MSILTPQDLDEAKKELTFESFFAYFVAMSTGHPMPLWLASSEEAKEKAIARAKAHYERWVAEELQMLERRTANDPFRNLVVVDTRNV